MHSIRSSGALLFFVWSMLPVGRAAAPPPADLLGPAATIWVENDAVFRTDRHYTHGSRIGYLSGESDIESDSLPAALARQLPAPFVRYETARWGLQIGQSLYTPTDLHDPLLQLNDRPYAAWLFATTSIQRRGTMRGGVPTLDSWSLDMGIIGPGALGEELQNSIHRVDAVGWEHQLHNEPGLDLEWAHLWRFSTGAVEGWRAQMIPFAGVRAGTVQVYGSAGIQLRAGWAIPEDFGRHTLDDAAPETGGRPATAGRSWHAYLLAGFEGRAVGWNMLLDGNLWHESHSVEKWPVVADAKAGFVVGWGRIEFAYIHVFRTQEYRGQPEVDSFGSLAISVRW